MAIHKQPARSLVIEKGVEIEAGITQILADLLNIDLSKSVAFGNGSASLNIFSKIQLLKELDYTPKRIANYLTMFIEIRNKFAHVLEIDSFVKYFELTGKSEKDKNRLIEALSLYKEDYKNSDEEERLRASFIALCIQIEGFLKLVTMATHSKKKIENIRNEINDTIIAFEDGSDTESFIKELKEYVVSIGVSQGFLSVVDGFKDSE